MLEPEMGCSWRRVSYFSSLAPPLHVIAALHMLICPTPLQGVTLAPGMFTLSHACQ